MCLFSADSWTGRRRRALIGGVFNRLARLLASAPSAGGADLVGIESPFADNSALSRITWDSLFPGVDADCWPIARASAMSVPAVAGARHRIVSTLSRLPILAVKDGSPWPGANDSLLSQPDPGQSHFLTMRETYDDILFAGRSFWLVVAVYPDAVTGGVPRLLPRDAVHVPVDQVRSDDDGWPVVAPKWLEWLKRTRRLDPIDRDGRPFLIDFAGPHDGLLTFGARAIRGALDLDRAARTAAANPVPSIELHQTTDVDMPDADIDSMVSQWQAARLRGGVGYTNAAVELRTHGQAPEQLLIDGRNQAAVEVARLAGLPASAIDASLPGTSLTYSNLIDRVFDLVNFGLSPYAVAITARLSMDDCLPRGVLASTDYSSLYPATAPNQAIPTTRGVNQA